MEPTGGLRLARGTRPSANSVDMQRPRKLPADGVLKHKGMLSCCHEFASYMQTQGGEVEVVECGCELLCPCTAAIGRRLFWNPMFSMPWARQNHQLNRDSLESFRAGEVVRAAFGRPEDVILTNGCRRARNSYNAGLPGHGEPGSVIMHPLSLNVK
jgi:hypothetical protein